MNKKKILIISIITLACIVLVFIGYHYIKYIKATARMKELGQQLEQKISIQEQKEYRRPPLSGPVIPGNAAVFYQEAETKIEKPGEEIMMQLYDAIKDPTKPLAPEVKAYYERNKAIIEIVKKGVNTETYKPLMNIRDGFNAKIPPLLSTRALAQIMVLQGRELKNNNQVSEAIELYCSIPKFGDDYVRGGFLIPAILGVMISEIGREEIHRLLLNNKLSEQDLRELLGHFKILFDSEPSFQNVWEAEGLCLEAGLKQMAESSGFILSPPPDFMISGPKAIWINRTDFVDAWEDIIIFYKEIKKIDTLPYIQAEVKSGKFVDKIMALKNPISRIILPHMFRSRAYYLQSQAYRRGIYILAALKLYYVKYQTYPDDLTALSPKIIPEVPLCPFTDKPFIYRIDPDQNILLYSIGRNLKDDGGDKRNDDVISPAEYVK